ncbi:MAG: ABC transporter ATP-binding protein [Campylobacterota bacterium]|nr:ABC transporter ATP-binding protein [Campylobacterota bacterium]
MKKLTWHALFNEAKQHKKQIVIGQVIAFFAVVLSLPIPLLFPLLIDEVLLDKPASLVATMDALFAPNEIYMYIVIIFFITLFFRLMFFILNAIGSKVFTSVSKEIVYSIRTRLLYHLKDVSIAEYESLGGGGISSKLVTDINTVDTFLGVSIGRFFISVLSLIGIAVILLTIDFELALIILVINPIVVTVTMLLGKRIGKLKRAENENIETFQNALSETLDLFIQVRTHNQEERYIDKMVGNAKAIKDASTSFGWKSEAASHLSSFIFLSGFEVFRATAMFMVLMSDLSIGEMFAVIGYLWFMITPLQELLNIIFSYANASTALQRLDALLCLEKEPHYTHVHNPFKETTTNAIELKNICFSYGDKEILHDVNIKIPKGKTVALLGSSGSGKTTLAHILLGLYATKKGDISVDGTHVADIGLDVMRENIALVLQQPKMFNDSLRHNLTLGREITDEKLYKALHIAQLESVMEKLTDGLNTQIGKDGIRLSGGERQRAAIARMLVTEPNVIILDESTSALDVVTEANLFRSLQEHLEEKSMLIITHRLKTIENADYIYILNEGRVVEEGTPTELLALQDGKYSAYFNEVIY